jgi:hypothetical protein
VTAAEQVPPVDLRTRIAAAFEAEDARNWGYDHGFEADDFETLAFADVAIAVMAGEERPLAAADEDRDRLAAELAAAQAEIERWRAAEVKRLRRLNAESPPVNISTDERGEADPPLPTTEDYRVVARDRPVPIGSTVCTLAEAEQQMATYRRRRSDLPPMEIWRREQVWSVAAVETRDAKRAPESSAGAPTPGATPDA